MNLRTCVSPDGVFIVGIHRPSFSVANMRAEDGLAVLGQSAEGHAIKNERNFPASDLTVEAADWIYEIANAFPFRGATYISRAWAEAKAGDPGAIRLPVPAAVSFRKSLAAEAIIDGLEQAIVALPRPLRLALATTSTDPDDLGVLAKLSCELCLDETSQPTGLKYSQDSRGRLRPVLHDHELFEAVANNPFLPDIFKEVMVLRPGVQGDSEIVGEWLSADGGSHVFEYLRRNSYIPWGHHASNLANDSIRYSVAALTMDDVTGLRHLYYQRTYLRVAEMLGLPRPAGRRAVSPLELEGLRLLIAGRLPAASPEQLPLNATLWGWNYGFDYAPSLYRLHASHQQIHQQFALIPRLAETTHGSPAGPATPSYACGDLVADFAEAFERQTRKSFFACFLAAIQGNQRVDGRTDRDSSLVIHEDGNVILFAPKAQTSQWELQLICLRPVGNILEADQPMRDSLDNAILLAMQALTGLGARMITTIEFSKRFDDSTDQRLFYSFLPKLPESPGAFSEAQLRFINGHYPEDFAIACRRQLARNL